MDPGHYPGGTNNAASISNNTPPFFLGAPLSKAICCLSCAFFVVCETLHAHSSISLDWDRVYDGEFYRMFSSQLVFRSIGELLFGMGLMSTLIPRFEREMGTRRIATRLAMASLFSATWEWLWAVVFDDVGVTIASGPYPWIGTVLALFHCYTPRIYPQFFGVLGIDFSEKSVAYGIGLQLAASGGWSTLVPVAFGFAAGLLGTTPALAELELPSIFYRLGGSIGGPLFFDRPPRRRAVLAAPRPGRPASAAAVTTAPPPPPEPIPEPMPPSEEAVQSLTAMGFERDAVMMALQRCDNNVEVAANQLLNS